MTLKQISTTKLKAEALRLVSLFAVETNTNSIYFDCLSDIVIDDQDVPLRDIAIELKRRTIL